VGSRVFQNFWHQENEGEDWDKITKGEFLKGPRPLIKGTCGEWSRFEESPERFSQGVVFQNFGTQKVEGPRTVYSQSCELWNLEKWTMVTGIFQHLRVWEFEGPRIVAVRIMKSQNVKTQKHSEAMEEPRVVKPFFWHFDKRELEGQGAWESSHVGVPKPQNVKGVLV
jgi:hypothetical protein